MAQYIILIILCSVCMVYSVKNVTIMKCCKSGEYLTNENKCLRYPENEKWYIRIYTPGKKGGGYLPVGTLPTNWHMKENFKPNCPESAIFTSEYQFIPFLNGSLFVIEYSKLIHPNNYCIDYRSVLVCLGESKSVVRIKKCCGKDAIFSETNHTCIKMKDDSYKIDLKDDKTLGVGFPTCPENKIVFPAKLHDTEMYDNGSLWLPDIKLIVPVANYCLENVLENSGRSPSVIICHDALPTVKIEPTTDLRFILYPIGLALSAIFLAATLAAGSLLPASHHVLHWRCQTNHVACLLVGDVLLCITQLSGHMSFTPCFIIAVLMHFLFLAAFFWLNTMCFNIWWTFRDLRPQNMEKGQEKCRLRLYEIYAWGGPFAIAGTAAILDLVADSNSEFLHPSFGVNKCWFKGNSEILTFFFGPIGILLMINLALFALTARELTCGLWKRELVKSTTERAALGRVCLKLVVVMGVTWIVDVISWLVGGPAEAWYLTDLINCFQGVFIFIVVGCQPQVLSAVKRLWCLRKQHDNGTAGTTNHHSSSSQGPPSVGDSITNNSITNNTTKSIPLETSC